MLRVVNNKTRWLLLWGTGGLMLLSACAPESLRLSNQGAADLIARPTQALLALQNAQVLAPDDPLAYYNAGVLHALGPDARALVQAEAMLTQAMAADDPALTTLAAYNLGVVQYNQGRYADAAASFQQVLRLDPADSDARYNYELALMSVRTPTPADQQQKTNPDEDTTDPDVTPTNQPNALDGPTPTPPRQESTPDPSETPGGGTGDFRSTAESTPQPREGGQMTVEEAQRVLDLLADEQQSLSAFLKLVIRAGQPLEKDW